MSQAAGVPSVYFAQARLGASHVGGDVVRSVSCSGLVVIVVGAVELTWMVGTTLDAQAQHCFGPFRTGLVLRPIGRVRWRGLDADSWCTPSSADMKLSVYARSPYVGGGSVMHHVRGGIASPPTILQPQHTRMRYMHVNAHAQAAATPVATVPFPGPAAVREVDCSRTGPGSNSSHVSLDLSGSLQSLGSETRDITEAPTVGFTSANQTWEEMVGMELASRMHPPPVHPWQPSGQARTQPPSLIGNDTSSIQPGPPQNVEDDDEVYTLLCQWTDEHGTCNMNVFGDRVWMSHHLSRRHNVVGHEKFQRACLWQGCADTMNKGSLARHVVSRHLRAGASCGFCSKVYSRADVARRHTKKCKVANGGSIERDQTKW
ncbi:hypothetical protein JVT61DRAFT_14094 [Boletus reticuloceps]|uniref:Uncharacterized protein n=1 Tax=Boletus reticuloceps TaxID=495285 RepID=A0A8I2YS72_9AGAM|nr:hypothetical protein JVT61DRAFT_14094 [Boletus reticuloceps]